MSETLQIWLFAAAFALIGLSFAWQWAHRHECESCRIASAKARGDIDYLLNEVGEDHNAGMRARLHFLENRVLRGEQ